MNKKGFINELEKLLELKPDTLDVSSDLDQYEAWDSITQLSLIAWVDENLDLTIEIEGLEKMHSVNNILEMLGDKLDGA